MYRRSVALLLVVMLMMTSFGSLKPKGSEGVVFAASDEVNQYSYSGVGHEGEKAYYFSDGVGPVYLNDSTKGKLMVQDYYVADISWLGSNAGLWNRGNMYDESRVMTAPKPVGTNVRYGYGSITEYYDDYMFYTNGNSGMGAVAKSARRIWGYYVPNRTGEYRFTTVSDDGHYLNFYNEDVYYNSLYEKKYDYDTYAKKWSRYYDNGINFNNPSTSVDETASHMLVTAHTSSTNTMQMEKGKIYPIYLEYFNWGGGGKFYITEEFRVNDQQNFSSNGYVSTNKFYANIANIPTKPNNSGIDLTVENGVRTVHAYDDFNDKSIDQNVWENNRNSAGTSTGFVEVDGVLRSRGGLSTIKLHNEYLDYDSYEMRIDFVDVSNQERGHSNGGIGVSKGFNDIWVNQLQLNKKSTENDIWNRKFSLVKYGTVGSEDLLEEYGSEEFNDVTSPNNLWKNKALRMEIKAVRNDEGNYDVVTKIYEKQTGVLLTEVERNNEESVDFNKFYLSSIDPDSNWVVSFDNFDFVAKKNMKFSTLVATHEENEYVLTWDEVEGATGYYLYYGSSSDSTRTKYNSNPYSPLVTSVRISDSNALYNTKYFKVVAIVPGGEVGSNAVKLNGNINGPTLEGKFSVLNETQVYDASWAKVSGATKYELYYGDDEGSANTKFPNDPEDIIGDSTKMHYLVENVDALSEYYGKYIQLRTTIGDVVYHSNVKRIKTDISLGVEHYNNEYHLKWNVLNGYRFSQYVAKYDDSSAHILEDGYGTDLKYTLNNNTRELVLKDDNSTIMNDGSRVMYNDKYFIIDGIYGSNRIHSNYIKLAGDVTAPTLEWSLDADGQQVFRWNTFGGLVIDDATEVSLYYGETVDDISTVIEGAEDLGTTVTFMTKKQLYRNKYVQLKVKKDGVTYLSNVIKSVPFMGVAGEIRDNGSKKNFTIKWTDLNGDEDYSDVELFKVYYENPATGATYFVETVKGDTYQYTIPEIYTAPYTDDDGVLKGNSDKLNMKFYVVAEFRGDVKVKSTVVIPRRVTFDSLNGVMDNSSNFDMNWKKPQKDIDGVLTDIDVKEFKIVYGIQKNQITTIYSTDDLTDPVFTDTEREIPNVDKDSPYYNMFFKVKAYVDSVSYLSNTVYSGEAPDLSAEKDKNSYKFIWPTVQKADSFKVYYSKKNDSGSYDDYVVYIPKKGEDQVPESAESWLNGDATSFVLDDITGEDNAIYDHSKFKIAAVFDGFEIESNEIEVNSELKVPSISGNYSSELNGYLIRWAPVGNADERKLFYREGRDIVPGSEMEIPNQEGINLNADGKYQYLEQDVENSILNEMHVRLAVTVGKIKLYSNSVFVNKPVIQGGNLNIKQGDFEDDAIKLRVGNRFDAVYDFKVFKEMFKPYFKLKLNGTKYLNFDKLTVEMMDVTDETPVEMPVKFMLEEDVKTGQTIVYVHLIERTVDDRTFVDKFEEDHDYRLIVTSIIDVTDKADQRKKVYDTLETYLNSINEKYETWKLPYFITNLEIDNEKIDKDMHIQYDASWNSTDAESSTDQRETSKELFDYEVNMKNKNQLPSSL